MAAGAPPAFPSQKQSPRLEQHIFKGVFLADAGWDMKTNVGVIKCREQSGSFTGERKPFW